MFKRLLLPVDPARQFGAANQYAVDLAHRFGSRIVATYIIDDHLLGPVAEEAHNSIDEALEWVGKDAMDDFVEHHPDLEIQKTLAYGSTPTAMFQMVLQTGADIVTHAERPVFVVRENARLPEAGDRIVVPFDGSERPLGTLPRIVQLAKESGAAIDLVYVAKGRDKGEGRAALERGQWLCDEEGVAVATHVITCKPWRPKGRAILNFARSQKSPLIALSRLGHQSMHTGRSRTVAWLLTHSPLPVWVVRK
ncbi:MAG: universal stress protein [Thermoplasmatota archaeon]